MDDDDSQTNLDMNGDITVPPPNHPIHQPDLPALAPHLAPATTGQSQPLPQLTEEQARPFPCFCGKRYTRLEHLERHKTAAHDQNKKFACKYCQKSFARKDILRRHELGHEKTEGPGADDEAAAAAAQAQTPNSNKQRRTNKACDACSASKLRCTGDPCTRCIKADRPCTFARPYLKPGRSDFDDSAIIDDSPSRFNDTASANSNFDRQEGSSTSAQRDVPVPSHYRGARGDGFDTRWNVGSGDGASDLDRLAALSTATRNQNSHDLNNTSVAMDIFNTIVSFSNQSEFGNNGNGRPAGQDATVHPLLQQSGMDMNSQDQGATSNSMAFGTCAPDLLANPYEWLESFGAYSTSPPKFDLGLPGTTPTFGDVHLDPVLMAGSGALGLGSPIVGENTPSSNSDHSSLLHNTTPGGSSRTSSHPQLAANALLALGAGPLSPGDIDGIPLPGNEYAPNSPEGDGERGRKASLATTATMSPPGNRRDLPKPQDLLSAGLPTLSEDGSRLGLFGAPQHPYPQMPGEDIQEAERMCPKISDATWQSCLDESSKTLVENPSKGIRSLTPSLVQYLDVYINTYFRAFAPLIMPVHQPTFDPNKAEWMLTMAIASIGARYASWIEGSHDHARDLTSCLRKCLMHELQKDIGKKRSLQFYQALLLMMLIAFASGEKDQLEMTFMFKDLPIVKARREQWLVDRPQSEYTVTSETEKDPEALDAAWRRWIEAESYKKLGLYTLVYDGAACLMCDFEPNLSFLGQVCEATLPARMTTWLAPSPAEWRATFAGKSVPPLGCKFTAANKLVLNPSLYAADQEANAVIKDPFATACIIIILHNLMWHRRQQAKLENTLLPPTPATLRAGHTSNSAYSPFAQSLSAGFDWIEEHGLAVPTDHDFPGVIANSLELTLHLSSMTLRLPVNVIQSFIPGQRAIPALETWRTENGGEIMRRTVYHAGALLGITFCLGDHRTLHSPLEPFAAYYAVRTLVIYACLRALYPPPTLAPPPPTAGDDVRGDIAVPQVGGSSAMQGVEATGSGRMSARKIVKIASLLPRSDPSIHDWLATGGGEIHVEGVGILDGNMQTTSDLLVKAGMYVARLNAWRFGRVLGSTLVRLGKDMVHPPSQGTSVTKGKKRGNDIPVRTSHKRTYDEAS